MKIVLIIWRLFLYVFDSLLLLKSVPAKGVSGKKKILIMRLDVIGDLILWLDAARALRELFPEKEYCLTLLGNTAWEEMIDHLSFFDLFVFFERKKFLRNPLYRCHLLKKVRNEGFDIVVQTRFSREFMVDDAFIRTCNAIKRIGLAGDSANIGKFQKKISDRWYTELIQTSEINQTELRRNAALIHALGKKDFKSGRPPLYADKTLLNLFEGLPDKYYILAPGAGNPWRKWPVHNFSQLADKIYSCSNLTGIICGALSDRVAASMITSSSSAMLLDYTGQTSLPELIALVHRACFMVSNESVAVHIAAAVDTPSICILGGGHYGRFVPYDETLLPDEKLPVPVIFKMDCFGCNWKNKVCLKKNKAAPCIENIGVEEVWNKVQNIIEHIKPEKA